MSELQTICPDIDRGISPCAHYILGGHCTLDKHFLCLEYLRHNAPTLSYSSMKEFISCHRKFWYGHIMGLTLKEKSIRLLMGSIADKILQGLHSSTSNYDHESVLKTYINDNRSGDPDDPGIAELWAMLGLFNGYVLKEFHAMKGITQFAFKWQEPEYPTLRGFIDLAILEDKIGYEFKYTKNADWYRKYNISDQLCAYFIGAPSLERITLRAISVPLQRLGANEQPWDYADRIRKDFMRRPFHYVHDQSYWRSEFDLTSYMNRAKMIAKEIVSYSDMGIDAFYMNAPTACFVPLCDFLSICENGVISEEIYSCRKTR